VGRGGGVRWRSLRFCRGVAWRWRGFGLYWTWNWGVLYLWFAVVLMVGSDTDVNIRKNKLLLDNIKAYPRVVSCLKAEAGNHSC